MLEIKFKTKRKNCWILLVIHGYTYFFSNHLRLPIFSNTLKKTTPRRPQSLRLRLRRLQGRQDEGFEAWSDVHHRLAGGAMVKPQL